MPSPATAERRRCRSVDGGGVARRWSSADGGGPAAGPAGCGDRIIEVHGGDRAVGQAATAKPTAARVRRSRDRPGHTTGEPSDRRGWVRVSRTSAVQPTIRRRRSNRNDDPRRPPNFRRTVHVRTLERGEHELTIGVEQRPDVGAFVLQGQCRDRAEGQVADVVVVAIERHRRRHGSSSGSFCGTLTVPFHEQVSIHESIRYHESNGEVVHRGADGVPGSPVSGDPVGADRRRRRIGTAEQDVGHCASVMGSTFVSGGRSVRAMSSTDRERRGAGHRC